MLTRTVFRVQSSDGRGPFRPGFTGKWTDPDLWNDFPSIQDEFGQAIFNKASLRLSIMGGVIACACRSIQELEEWFSPTERGRLMKMGYLPVSIIADDILAEGAHQLVFWRKRPLQKHDGIVAWTDITHATPEAAE